MRTSDNNTMRIINSHMHYFGNTFWRYMDGISSLHLKRITDVGLSQRLYFRLRNLHSHQLFMAIHEGERHEG
jgi:hypothetical protein